MLSESSTRRLSPTRLQTWFITAGLVLPILAIFWPVLLGHRSLAFRDGAHFYHPLFQWIASEWGAGRVPLWNPYENCGLPILADATSSIFYPVKLLFVLPLPFALLYNFYIILHVLLAALGMHALARRYGASQAAAVVAALAYALGGNVVFQFCNIVFLVGAAWLPFALVAIEEVVTCRCWRAALFLAFVLAMMILGGDPQMAYQAMLLAGLRWLSELWGDRTPRETLTTSDTTNNLPLIPSRTDLWRGRLLSLGWLGLAAVVAGMLAAVQVLPSSEATRASERAAYDRPRNVYEAASYLARTAGQEHSPLQETPGEAVALGLFGPPLKSSHHDRAYDFSVSPWRVMEFAWPNVSGRVYPRWRNWISQLPASTKYWTPTFYLGLIPFLAGVCAVRLRRTTPAIRWLSWLVILFTLASFGWYGLGWLVREAYVNLLQGDEANFPVGAPVGGVYWLMVTLLPTYVYFRYPAKLLVIAVCALCALSAPALDRWLERPHEKLIQRLHYWTWFSGIIAFLVWIASAYIVQRAFAASSLMGPFDARGACLDAIGGLLQSAAVAWCLAWILRKSWQVEADQSNATVYWPWLAVALTAVDLLVANHWLIVTAPSSVWTTPGPVAAAIQADVARGQAPSEATAQPRYFRGSYLNWKVPKFQTESSANRLAEQATWEAETLFPKYHLLSRLPLVESYGSLKVLDYESLFWVSRNHSSLNVDGARVPHSNVLRLVATDYLLLPASAQIPYAEPVPLPAGVTLPENVSLWRMKATLPRARIVDHVVQLPPLATELDLPAVDQRANEVLRTVIDGKSRLRNFQATAVVESDAKLMPSLLEPADATAVTPPSVNSSSFNPPSVHPPAATCEITRDTPQHVQVTARLSRPGLLVLADAWNAGWQATVRPLGEPAADEPAQPNRVPIHRTNRCFRGVELPSGEWQIDFHYRPASFHRGAWISGLSWLAFVVLVIVGVSRPATSGTPRSSGENQRTG
jgi:hypothetical protein